MLAQLTHAAGESASEWTAQRSAQSLSKDLLDNEKPEDVPSLSKDDVRDALDPVVGWCAPERSLALPEHTFAVVLAADDEAHLLDIEQRLCAAGIPHRTIHEPDAPYLGAATAIGIHPAADRALLRPITGKLRLLK